MSLAKWLLRTAVYSSIITLASAAQTTVIQTVQNTQTKYRISVLTQTSTLVETTYEILTFTPPPVIQPEYIPYTVYRGTTTVSVTPAAITEVITDPGITADITSIYTVTVTQPVQTQTVVQTLTQPARTVDFTNIETVTITAAAITVTQPAATFDITSIDTLTITVTQSAATLDVTDIETLTVTKTRNHHITVTANFTTLEATTTTVVIPPPPPVTITSTETVGGSTVTVSGGACSSTSLAPSSSSLQSLSASSSPTSVVSSSAAPSSGAASYSSGSSSATSSSTASSSGVASSTSESSSAASSSGAASSSFRSSSAPGSTSSSVGSTSLVSSSTASPAGSSGAPSTAKSSNPSPTCTIAGSSFIIAVEEQSTATRYLIPASDSALTELDFTSSAQSAAVFSLDGSNDSAENLDFSFVDDSQDTVVLYPAQESGEGGQQAVYFATASIISGGGIALTARLNSDCTISLLLPNSTSNNLYDCSIDNLPQLYLLTNGQGPENCVQVILAVLPVPGPASSSSIAAPSTTSRGGSPSSSTSAPGSSTVLGSSTSAAGSSISIPGSSTSALGSSTALGSSASIPGSSTVILGSSTKLSSSTSVTGSSTSIPGSSTVPSSSTSAPGSSTSASGSSSTRGESSTSSSTPASSSSTQNSTSGAPSTTSSTATSTTSTTTTSITTTSTTSTTSSSTTIITSSTTTSCSPLPSSFNIGVVESGSGTQYLANVNVAGGLTEGYWGYDKLSVTSSLSSAAIFSVDSFNRLTENVYLDGTLTEVHAAVRVSAIGDSIMQLYPSNHFNPADMVYYTAKVNRTCAFNIFARGANILALCGGELSILSSRYQQTRGVSCAVVHIYPIPYVAPPPVTSTVIAITTLSTVTSSVPAASSTAPTCVLPSYFTILVNETGAVPQYLWDPNSDDDEALSFTTDPAQSLIFTLTLGTNQLQFDVMDLYNHNVTLVSEQDMQNAGNEAVFFTTSARFTALGYLPVVANLLPDCSLGLTLPYDAANTLVVCEGTLWLVLNPNELSGCSPVKLDIIPYV